MVQWALVCVQTYISGRKPDGPVGSRERTDIYKWKETRWSRWLSCAYRHIYVEGNQMVQVALVCVQTYISGRKPDGPVGSRVCTDIYKWKETRWSRWLSYVYRHIYVEGNQMVQVALVCVQTYISGRKPDGPVVMWTIPGAAIGFKVQNCIPPNSYSPSLINLSIAPVLALVKSSTLSPSHIAISCIPGHSSSYPSFSPSLNSPSFSPSPNHIAISVTLVI